jgi:hypothetical protein
VYRTGAKANDRKAERHLGFCHRNGLGTEPDLIPSVECSQLSFDEGDIEGGQRSAVALQFGIGCDEDLDEAADYDTAHFKDPLNGGRVVW